MGGILEKLGSERDDKREIPCEKNATFGENMRKKKVLFICTHNSARSQMAEGMLRSRYGNRYEAYSAGTEPSTVRPQAITAMNEIGVDISDHRSKNIEEFRDVRFDIVVTVCDHAKETCLFFPGGKKYIHRGFNDPSECAGSEEEMDRCFRKVRDEIGEWIGKTFGRDGKDI